MSPYFLLIYVLFVIYLLITLIFTRNLKTLDKLTWAIIISLILVVGPLAFMLHEQ